MESVDVKRSIQKRGMSTVSNVQTSYVCNVQRIQKHPIRARMILDNMWLRGCQEGMEEVVKEGIV